MKFTASAIAAATGGTLVGPDLDVVGVSIDSRSITGGQLFVPIVAQRDGHDFIPAALRADAGAYLTAQQPAGGTAIVVSDTLVALEELGHEARRRLGSKPVIGVTGSVGKTTVKDLTAAALWTTFKVAASERSFNNELGVPLTLVNARDDVDVAVVEMGARGIGHIQMLCEVARPTIGIVTRIARAHTELFGVIEDVARAKGELVEALPPSGTAVLNADDPLVLAMARRTRAQVLTYGEGEGADVRGTLVLLDESLHPTIFVESPFGRMELTVPVAGAHQVGNVLAALAAAVMAGSELADAAVGLETATISPARMQLGRARSGATILNDAYNANPASMEAGLRALAALPARRHIAVLGRMAELGEISDAEHQRMAALAEELAIEVIAVDAPAYGVKSIEGVEAALAALDGIGEGDAVLVKGSLVAGLQRLASALIM